MATRLTYSPNSARTKNKPKGRLSVFGVPHPLYVIPGISRIRRFSAVLRLMTRDLAEQTLETDP